MIIESLWLLFLLIVAEIQGIIFGSAITWWFMRFVKKYKKEQKK